MYVCTYVCSKSLDLSFTLLQKMDSVGESQVERARDIQRDNESERKNEEKPKEI